MIDIKKINDIRDKRIEAHGGWINYYQGFFYWYGENRVNDNYVSCYKSSDLINWEFMNNVLTVNSKVVLPNSTRIGALMNDDGSKVNIERPKVVFNELTKKFVMWMHYENGKDYSEAACCVATCDTPDGDFCFNGAFRPLGNMSRDCTLFLDDDEKCYFISAGNDNKDLFIYKLNKTFNDIDSFVNKIFISELREAPALFKRDNMYYILTSYCTGWFPNQCKYSYTDNLYGKFSKLKNIGNKTTSKTQPFQVLKVGDRFIYLGDRWGGKYWNTIEEFDYFKSTYAYTFIRFVTNTKLIFTDKEFYDGRDKGNKDKTN